MNHPKSPRGFRFPAWALLLVAPGLLIAEGCRSSDGGGGLGDECGGLSGASCGALMFCSFEADAACGAADQTGTCELIPRICTQDFTPVCGCDDRTYANACTANSAGVSVARTGECPGLGDGCAESSSCGLGMFCSFNLEDHCGVAGEEGTCQLVPDACTQQFAPVCGCDDRTYDNECVANAAGVSVFRPGECPGLGDACFNPGPACGEGQFCLFSIQAGCGVDPGVCEVTPDACTREFVPVCGCDRQSYDNECLAHSAGVSVAGPGACP